MATLTPSPKMQFLDANGNPLVGGKLYTYMSGTTTPLATYTDYSGGTPNTNPIILDSRGEASVWVGAAFYYMELKSSTDVLQWAVDNIGGYATLVSLAANSGATLIGVTPSTYNPGTTVQAQLTNVGSATGASNVGFTQSGTGTVARTAQDKERDIVSVKDFGAVGDGVTDNTVAFQAAVTAAAGGKLELQEGTYLIGKVTLPSSIIIEGKGVGTIIKLVAGHDDHLLTAASASGITLKNLTLDGNKANQTAGAASRGLYLLDSSDIRLVDVIVQNCADHGVHASVGATTDPLSDSVRIWTTRCKFLTNGTIGAAGGSGLAVSGDYLWATDCYSEGNLLSGFKFTGSHVSAKGCHAIDNDAGGFTTGFDSVTEEGSIHVYEACYALNNGDGTNGGDGFRHQGQVDRIIHRDCFAVGNKWSGISLVANSTTKPTNVDIYGGSLLNNGQSFTPAATVAGSGLSVLSTSTTPNIPSYVRLHGVTITDDQGFPTQTYGVEIQDGSDVYIGEGCRLAGNLTSSLYNAATLVTNVRLSPSIIDGDFVMRTMTAGTITGSLTETDLQAIVIPANTLNPGQRYRIHARGEASGTNGTKAFRIYFGSTSYLFSSQLAADQQAWFIDGIAEIAGVASQKVSITGSEVGGATVSSILSSSSNANTAITCKITGTLGNVGDTATCSSFFFDPIY